VPKLGLQSLLRKKPSEIEEKAAEEEAIEQTLPEKARLVPKLGLQSLLRKKPSEIEEKAAEEEAIEQTLPEKATAPALEAPSEDLDYVIRHASGKILSEEEIFEAKHYARELKYPKGALVFNGTDEDDFLYCLLDNKELSVCWEMDKSMGFPKLEADLCAMTKDDLADSLVYNSLKVQKVVNFEVYGFCSSLLFSC
jgi:Tfp pilus assembly protein PilO